MRRYLFLKILLAFKEDTESVSIRIRLMILASLLGIWAPRNLHRYISLSIVRQESIAIHAFSRAAKQRLFDGEFSTLGDSLLQLESPLTSRRARTKFRGRVKLDEEIFRNLRVLFYGWRFKWKKPYPAPVPISNSTLKSPLPRSPFRSTKSSSILFITEIISILSLTRQLQGQFWINQLL